MRRLALVIMRWLAAGALAAPAAAQNQGATVINTPHNLSTSGPAVIRAATEEQVCIFCHATHRASPVQPLWNRQMSVTAYIPYSSSALDALPGQPTGASKMCLSCHDGTIALGSVVSRTQVIQMASGITTLPPGTSNLGTDLSDDHPMSFAYDSSLAAKDAAIVPPGLLPAELKLDVHQELQCTTCHDAHDNSRGDFLSMNNTQSAMCRSCHQISSTSVIAHEDCSACHQVHTAPSGPFLLKAATVSDTCLTCHDGSVLGAKNVAPDLVKFSVHDTFSAADPVDPVPGTTSCSSCHDPHTMLAGTGLAPTVHPNFGRVDGVNSGGIEVEAANNEYEVCYRCHADDSAIEAPFVPRQHQQTNTRLEFALSAISYHPVQGPGRSSDVPSLKPPLTTGSVVYCSDCHGTEFIALAGSNTAQGVHGSNHQPLLRARYETLDFTPESASTYALCYECHYRDGADGILSDRSFVHSLHVVDQRTPCSVCHDAHGVSSAMNNSHLINFDSRVVFTDPVTGRLEFRDLGTFSGSCTLVCHGTRHEDESYDR